MVLRVELNADTVPWTFQADAPCIQASVHIMVKEGLSRRKEWDLIYSQFEKGFMYMTPGKMKLCKLFIRLQTNEQDKQG